MSIICIGSMEFVDGLGLVREMCLYLASCGKVSLWFCLLFLPRSHLKFFLVIADHGWQIHIVLSLDLFVCIMLPLLIVHNPCVMVQLSIGFDR